MTLPTIDGLHYVGCHCNGPCTCDDIECVHEQCICDRLSTAYQRGREDEQNEHRVQGEGQVPFAAARGGR